MLLLERPDVSARSLAPGAVGAALIFLVYLLFIDGGVFAVYLEDRKLSRAEFFENAGLFFWRMVRLALYSVVPFGLLAAADGGIARLCGKALERCCHRSGLGFFVNVGGKLVIVLLALFVRLWFDLAQARMVRDNEREVVADAAAQLRNLHSAPADCMRRILASDCLPLVRSRRRSAYGCYLPHSAMVASFLVLELVTITQIASRLWMKAASARWIALLPTTDCVPATDDAAKYELHVTLA